MAGCKGFIISKQKMPFRAVPSCPYPSHLCQPNSMTSKDLWGRTPSCGSRWHPECIA